MRLSSIILVAAASAIFSSTKAMTTDHAKSISTVESLDLVRPLEADNHADTEQRFLRRHQAEEEDEEEGNEAEEENEEERAKGANLFAPWKLDEMASSVKTFKRFANWKAYGLSPYDVYTRLEAKGIYKKYEDLYSMYNRNYATI
ncbi:hypothetical protein PHYPSEUDO_002658 [Phytophthora pseudosyringae]|uniref:RxLR effector protein n=1 Tax=Phytophthora pseudosyringae TaxID=221518 RepID=A0A8T1VT24_9STRA|nr:hypothetical protein PHYPSEUDO_002658 [Phytophthora pseudosyringae]